MSVFSFGKTDRVWGLKRSITMDMIDWWIEQVEPKPYLLKIKQSYDHGYNHGDLAEVTDEDKAELRDLVRMMLKDGYENRLRRDAVVASQIRESIVELEQLIDADLEGTRFQR